MTPNKVKKTIAIYLIKLALKIIPFTPKSHKLIANVCDKWTDELNEHYWKPNKIYDK